MYIVPMFRSGVKEPVSESGLKQPLSESDVKEPGYEGAGMRVGCEGASIRVGCEGVFESDVKEPLCVLSRLRYRRRHPDSGTGTLTPDGCHPSRLWLLGHDGQAPFQHHQRSNNRVYRKSHE